LTIEEIFQKMLCNNLKGERITDVNQIDEVQTILGSSLNLTKIPENLKHFPNLRHLYLDKNYITEMENLEELNKLVILDLSHNKIIKISNLDKKFYLKDLNLSNNLLQEIIGLEDLYKLEKLNLKSNFIHKIEGLDNLKNIKELYMDNMNIKYNIYKNIHSINKTFLKEIKNDIGKTNLKFFYEAWQHNLRNQRLEDKLNRDKLKEIKKNELEKQRNENIKLKELKLKEKVLKNKTKIKKKFNNQNDSKNEEISFGY
jgi:protein phosphatase 1 regulatory subunit 7